MNAILNWKEKSVLKMIGDIKLIRKQKLPSSNLLPKITNLHYKCQRKHISPISIRFEVPGDLRKKFLPLSSNFV